MNFTDLRLGYRLLLRQPLTAGTAIVALTVGIALANVGFATMEALLFSRLPFEGGDRFVRISAVTPLERQPVTVTAEGYARLQSGATTLEHIGAFTSGVDSIVLPSGQVIELTTAAITPSSLRYIPGVPLRGRPLSERDGQPGAESVAVIGETFWRHFMDASDSAVGATVTIGATTHIVVGVMPATFEFPNSPDVWLPLTDAGTRLFGVLAPGATLEMASAQLAAIGPQLKAASGTDDVAVEVTAITDLGDMAPLLSGAIVMAVMAVLIVIAANVGNLVMVRSFARAREFAVRAALGASRARLVMQVLTEVMVIGSVAAVLGSLAAQAILRQLNALDDLPFWVDFTGSAWTMVMVVGATLVATAIAGAWPALKATRQDVLGGLRSGDGRTSDVRFGRAAGAMVVTQIALSVVMLHGALVVAQSLRSYTSGSVDLPRNVLTQGLEITGDRVTADEVERYAAAMPGVIAAGTTTALPRHSPAARMVEVEALPGEAPRPARRSPSASVSPSYFAALGASVRAGRHFTATDTLKGAPLVAIVNEPFVRDVFGNTSVIGRRFRTVGGEGVGPWIDIVGVVPDLGLSVGDPTMAAGYYLPLTAAEKTVFLAMRTTGEPMTYAEPLRRWLRERDAEVSLFAAERLEDVAMEDRAFFAVLSSALSGIGGITLVLALVGVYSMMSLIITRRTREIGIRVALGATPRLIIKSVAVRAAWQVSLGGAIGAGLALLSLNGRAVLVSRLGDGGSWTLPLVMVLLIAAGLMATWVPLRRALRIRPQEALKAE